MNDVIPVIVLGPPTGGLPRMFRQVGETRDIPHDNPRESTLIFKALIQECLTTKTALLLQDVPVLLIGALVLLSARGVTPQIYATISRNLSSDGEPDYKMVGIVNILTEEMVWELD